MVASIINLRTIDNMIYLFIFAVYLDCRKPPEEDPCLHRHCQEDQVCFAYQPPGCVGCSSLPECRTVPVPCL